MWIFPQEFNLKTKTNHQEDRDGIRKTMSSSIDPPDPEEYPNHMINIVNVSFLSQYVNVDEDIVVADGGWGQGQVIDMNKYCLMGTGIQPRKGSKQLPLPRSG